MGGNLQKVSKILLGIFLIFMFVIAPKVLALNSSQDVLIKNQEKQRTLLEMTIKVSDQSGDKNLVNCIEKVQSQEKLDFIIYKDCLFKQNKEDLNQSEQSKIFNSEIKDNQQDNQQDELDKQENNVKNKEQDKKALENGNKYLEDKSLNTDKTGENTIAKPKKGDIILSEIFPNPVGADKDLEWIELYNTTDKDFQLDGFKLDDGEKGSKPFVLKNVVIKAKSFLVLKKSLTNIVLNNSNEEVRFFDKDDNLLDQVQYDKAPEGLSFAYFQNGWKWTQKITPGSANVYYVKTNTNQVNNLPKQKINIVQTDLKNVYSLPDGKVVKLKGFVIVDPNVLGKGVFYLGDYRGIQVYFSKADFGDLKQGDEVEIVGELGMRYGEKRIKIKDLSAIKVLSHNNKVQALKIQANDRDNYTGGLVKISGIVTEKKGNTLIVDDGSDEIDVYIKGSIDMKNFSFKQGDKIEVAGVLIKKNNTWKLLPRSVEDFKPIELIGQSVFKNLEKQQTTSQLNLYNLNYLIILLSLMVSMYIGFYLYGKQSLKNKLLLFSNKFKKINLRKNVD